MPQHPDDLGGVPGSLQRREPGGDGISEGGVFRAGPRSPVVVEGGPSGRVFDQGVFVLRGGIGNGPAECHLGTELTNSTDVRTTSGAQRGERGAVIEQNVALGKLEVDGAGRQARGGRPTRHVRLTTQQENADMVRLDLDRGESQNRDKRRTPQGPDHVHLSMGTRFYWASVLSCVVRASSSASFEA